MAYGRLDSFEGMVPSGQPEKAVGWSQRCPSVFNIAVGVRLGSNPDRK